MQIKQHHKYIVYVTIAFLFGRAFSLPRPASSWEGTNSTISPGYVEGFDGNFSNIYVDTGFYLNGELKNDVLDYPYLPIDYVIWYDDSEYQAKFGENSSIAYSSTSGSTVLQNCANDRGRIFLDLDSITFTDVVNITGNGSPTSPIEDIEIFGRGKYGTTIYQAQNKNAFNITDLATFHLHDVGFVIPSTNPKTCILGDDTGSDKRSLYHGDIGNIYIIGGSNGASGVYGIHLKSPLRWRLWGTNRFVIAGEGVVKIENTETSNIWGDGTIEGYHQFIMNGDNMVCLSLQGNPTRTVSLINGLGARIFMEEYGTRTGLLGIDADYASDIKLDVQMEGVDNAYDLAYSSRCLFTSPYILLDSAGTFFSVASSCSSIEFKEHDLIEGPNGAIVFDDNVTTERLTTLYEDIFAKATSGSLTIGTYKTQTKFSRVTIDQKFSENCFYATILSGNSSVDVTHGLWATPKQFRVEGMYSLEVAVHWISNEGSTTFRINVNATVSSDRNLKWYAHVSEGWNP